MIEIYIFNPHPCFVAKKIVELIKNELDVRMVLF